MRVLPAVLLTLLPSGAIAEISGNQLLSSCEFAKDEICLGFVSGAVAGLNFGGIRVVMLEGIDGAKKAEASLDAAIGICPPDGVDTGQTVDVVIKYLQAHPKSRHQPAVRLVRESLAEAFPCPTE